MDEYASDTPAYASRPPFWPLCIVSVGAILYALRELLVGIPIALFYGPKVHDWIVPRLWYAVTPLLLTNILWIVVLGISRYRSRHNANGRASTM
jgi:hypothetical protein